MGPVDHRFARAGLRGTWEPKESPGVCPKCTSTRQTRVRPLIIEWEPGSDIIGDFVWPGFANDIAIEVDAFEDLRQRFSGFESGPVEMVQDPKLRKPRLNTEHTKPRVWLSYEGPPLYDLWVTSCVDMDQQRTTAKLTKSCNGCGYQQYEIVGIERRSVEMDQDKMELAWTRTPRVPGQGLFLDKLRLNDTDIFRVKEFSGCILCTDRVKAYIEDRRLNNVTFLEYGDVF